MKKIFAIALAAMLLLGCAVFASAEEAAPLTALLKFADSDFVPATAGECPTEINGEGTYTLSVENITTKFGAPLDYAYMLYIEVEGGYATLKDMIVSDVKVVVDGEEIAVDQTKIYTYESLGADYLPNGNYCIEICNLFAGLSLTGGACIDPAINADESLSITFTLTAPVAEEVELPFVDGDQVKIGFLKNGTYISATANDTGKKLIEADEAGAAVWTVEETENGFYFICNGKYLTSGATGNSLTLEETPNEFSLWVLEAAENGWFIKNVNAAYNGGAQYLEYYSGFTTYGKKDTADVTLYTFTFEAVEQQNPPSGDAIFVVVAMLAASGMGLTAVVSKKK